MKNIEVFNKIKIFFKALFIKIKVIKFIRLHNLTGNTEVTGQWCNAFNHIGTIQFPELTVLITLVHFY